MFSLQPSTLLVDVAIVGGGIAGSALAITLRRLGMDVVLVEREPLFRDRIRGEEIHPWGVREIDALGLRPFLDEARALEMPFWTTYRDREPGEPYAWTTDVPDSPPALSVGHPRLQEVLLQAAQAEGARVFRPGTASPSCTADGWAISVEADGGPYDVRARLLIGADGKNSATRKLFGATAVRDAVHHQFGGILARGIDLPLNSAHQGYDDGGFAMVFPQQEDLARVYFVGPTDLPTTMRGPEGIHEFLQRVAACYPEGAFERAEAAGPMGFFPNADMAVDRIAGDRIALIGDAAGANDPTQGHGLSLVFRDVRVLRDALAADPATAPQVFGQERRSYYGILRDYASWVAPLLAGSGPENDAARDQVRAAREADPSAEGFANLLATGPGHQATDSHTRARFYGEHLPGARVRSSVEDGPLKGIVKLAFE